MAVPDSVRVAITFADDTVGIMSFVTAEYHGSVLQWARPPTPQLIAREIAKTSFEASKLPIKSWRLIQEDHIPVDRTYRNAWRDTGTEITHDIEHAREIHRDRLRAARVTKLAALDVAYLRADEKGDTAEKKRIAKAKQALRDLPAHPDIKKAKTVHALKAVWPEDLA